MSLASVSMRPDGCGSKDHVASWQPPRQRLQHVATPQRHLSKRLQRIDPPCAERPERATAQADSTRETSVGVKLDKNLFQNFWPLLDDCRDYARLRGCRFRSRSWDGLSGDGSKRQRTRCNDARSGEAAAVAKARAEAAPTVYRFAKRLREGDAALLEEVDRASRIVSVESVRSSMVATCQRLDLWPPPQSHVLEDDYRFEDVSAPLPSIAQRLYNDETRRQASISGSNGPDPIRRRAMMAMFITEFATAVGITQTESARTYEDLLTDFMAKASSWEETQNADGEEKMSSSSGEPNSEVLGSHVPAMFATRAMSALADIPKLIQHINQIRKH